MLKFWFQSKFAWLILTVITVVLVLFWMFSWTSRLNQKPLFLEFSGFYILFSFQGSLRCLSSNFYSLSKVFAFVNTFLFFYKSTFFRNFSEFVKNLQIISFVSCFVFVLVSRTYVMIPEFPRIVNDFSIFVILFILLWFFRIFWHFYLFHTYYIKKSAAFPPAYFDPSCGNAADLFWAIFFYYHIYNICSLLFPNTTVTRLRCAIFQNCT